MKNLRSKILLSLVTLLNGFASVAQGTGSGGSGNSQLIAQELRTWGGQIKTALNVVTAIFAIVGGFLIFFQYMQGNDQAQKNFIKYVIGLGIVALVNLIVQFFIGEDITAQ